jgi:putative membrane protein
MKMKSAVIAAAAALTVSGTAMAQQPGGQNQPIPQSAPASPDAPAERETPSDASKIAKMREGAPANAHAFIREAALGGMAEVELGRLAVQRASSDEVKRFAQRMVTDHGKANDELKTLAQRKNITLPSDIDDQHKQKKEQLSQLNGAAFDRAYMDEMRADHRKNVEAFREQSRTADDPEVKAFAAKQLPTLEEHLQMAERTNAAVGTSGSGNPDTKPTDRIDGPTRPGTDNPRPDRNP